MDEADKLLDVSGVPDRQLLNDIMQMMRDAAAYAPRSLQRTLGPSEIGTECLRQLAYGLTKTNKPNVGSDPLASIIGTASHHWMEDACRQYNERVGRVRFIPESKVAGRDDHPGTCDVYDVDTKSVLDWKFPGPTWFKKYRAENHYKHKVQRHTYARGFVRLGFDVQHAGSVYIPRAGRLRDSFMWREPYDESIVEEAFKRIDRVHGMIEVLDVEHKPENFLVIPKVPSDDCLFCPWFSPKPQGPRQCSGVTDKDH